MIHCLRLRATRPKFVFFILLLLSVISAPATASIPNYISLFARDNLDADGVQTFSLLAQVIRSPLATAKSLTAPSGQVFEFFASPGVFTADLGAYASLQQLTDSLPGEWTFQAPSPTDPMLLEDYRFTISPFSSSDLTVRRPAILQPANGAVVHGPFDIEWDPPSSNYGNGGINVLFERTLVRPGLLHVVPTFDPRFPPLSGTVSFSTSAGQNLNNFVANITPPDNAQFDLSVVLAFSRRIQMEVTVVPVPEPAPLVLLPGAVLALIAGCRRRMV